MPKKGSRNGKRPEAEQAAAGPLVPQEHGGAIWQGRPATIVPGPGRPSSELRARLTGSLEQRVPVLEAFADGRAEIRLVGKCPECGHKDEASLSADEIKAAIPTTADRLRAIDLMGKYGPGTVRALNSDDVQDRLTRTLQIITEHVPGEQGEALIDKLEGVWS